MEYRTNTPPVAWGREKPATGRKSAEVKKDALHYPVMCVLFLAILAGCASYRPMPLTAKAVQQRLAVPTNDTIRIRASQIHHPILRPITFDASNGLSPDEAAILAVLANPSLKAARDARGVASAQVLQAGILPNPQVSYSFESPVGGDTSGKVNALGIGLDWSISSLVAREARISAARSHENSMDLAIAWREWQVAEAAKLHVYRVLFAEKRLALTNAAKGILERICVTMEHGVTIGVETTAHLKEAQWRLQEARQNCLRTQAEVIVERLELSRVLGIPGGKEIRLEEGIPLPMVAGIPEISELFKDIEKRRLDLLALRYGYESQEERLRAAIKSQFPKISLGLTGGRDTDGLKTVGIGISISLPIFDRNQGRIAAAHATRRQLFDEYAARLFEARSDVAEISEELHSTLEQLQNADKTIRELQQLTEHYRKAADRGSLSIIDYYQVLLQLNAKKLGKLALQRRLVELAIGLEIASGRYIASGTEHMRRALKSACNSEDSE